VSRVGLNITGIEITGNAQEFLVNPSPSDYSGTDLVRLAGLFSSDLLASRRGNLFERFPRQLVVHVVLLSGSRLNVFLVRHVSGVV
jgi:hypothetical protein